MLTKKEKSSLLQIAVYLSHLANGEKEQMQLPLLPNSKEKPPVEKPHVDERFANMRRNTKAFFLTLQGVFGTDRILIGGSEKLRQLAFDYRIGNLPLLVKDWSKRGLAVYQVDDKEKAKPVMIAFYLTAL